MVSLKVSPLPTSQYKKIISDYFSTKGCLRFYTIPLTYSWLLKATSLELPRIAERSTRLKSMSIFN